MKIKGLRYHAYKKYALHCLEILFLIHIQLYKGALSSNYAHEAAVYGSSSQTVWDSTPRVGAYLPWFSLVHNSLSCFNLEMVFLFRHP
jgi:hypothetical protein